MKERKLTVLLALLAALALVFAGACSDGSDEAGTTETPSDGTSTGDGNGSGNGNGNGGNNNTSGDGNSENNENNNNENNDNNDDGDSVSDSLAEKIKGTEWKFTGTESAPGDSDSTGIYLGTVTLKFDDSGNVTGEASWWIKPSESNAVAHAGSISGTYKVDDSDGTTAISVTLGSGENTETFTLTLNDGSYSTDADSGIVTIKLSTDSTLAVGELSDASYTVTCSESDNATVDIFSSDTNGGIAESKQFKYQEGA